LWTTFCSLKIADSFSIPCLEKKTFEEMQKEPHTKKNLENDEKMRRRKVMENYYGKYWRYKSAIEMAKKEWLISTDGVVRAL
jgi:hypothetical protein